MSIECLNLSITKRRGMRLFEKRSKRTQNGFDYCNFRQWEATIKKRASRFTKKKPK